MRSTVTVMLIAPDRLTKELAFQGLAGHPSLQMLSGHEAVEADVVLMLVDRFHANGLAQLDAIGRERGCPMKPLVVVCHQIGEHQLLPAIDLGLVAVIDRDGATLNRIAEVIVNADAGRAHMSPKVLTAVLRTSRTARAAASVQPLVSARERDVVRLLSEGLATKEVAEGLGCSKRTIENIIMSLNARLRVRNPARLVAFGFHHGLL